jgi:nucleoside-diphosphate-sugar epimerase
VLTAIAGAHGQVARRLTRQLTAAGDEVVGIVRNPGHADDVAADGARPVVLDLERAGAQEVADAVRGAWAVVFSAGAGPGSGDARKETVDRAAAVLLADAAALAGVRRYALVSSMGVESVRGGAQPEGVEPAFLAYLRAKLAAEDELRARAASGALDLVVLRPGGLVDDPGTGLVHLEPSVARGSVPRDDVAAVLAALVRAPAPLPADLVLELVGGDEPVDGAVARVLRGAGGA